MTTNTKTNENSVVCAGENKAIWQCPKISRIDIKKTMSGSPGLFDLSGGNIPS